MVISVTLSMRECCFCSSQILHGKVVHQLHLIITTSTSELLSPAVSNDLLACSTQLPLPHKQWCINPSSLPIIPHTAGLLLTLSPGDLPQPVPLHSWTYAPFLKEVALVCVSSLLFSKLPWCQSPAVKR